jgi:hypothetical protein
MSKTLSVSVEAIATKRKGHDKVEKIKKQMNMPNTFNTINCVVF